MINTKELRDAAKRIAWLKGRDYIMEAANEIERLRKENFALAANQCRGGYGDDSGNHRCKYQDEIERLQLEKQNAWNRGHKTGTEGMTDALKDMSKTKSDYLDENELLTNMLLNAEEEIERLRKEIKAAAESEQDELSCIDDLIKVAVMPNVEHVGYAHNDAVEKLKAIRTKGK